MLGRLRRHGNAEIQCFAQNLRNIVILRTIRGHLFYTNLFSIQKWIINVEFSTENYSPTSRNLRINIPLTDPVLIQIQIWQPWIARQNILGSSECLLVLNRSRITKRNSKRVCCCWDNQKFLRKLRITAGGELGSKSPSPIRAAECFRPFHVFMGGKSGRKIETGLECGQPLLRKSIITTTPSRQVQGCSSYLDSQLSR